MSFNLIKGFILVLILGISCYQDIRTHKIRNHVTLTASLAGLIMNTQQQGLPGLWFSFQGWLIPVLALMVLFKVKVTGAGDIKLFAAIGSMMGLHFVLYCFFYSLFFGALFAVMILIKRNNLIEKMTSVFYYLFLILSARQLFEYHSKDDRDSKFAFTTAIVPGVLVQLFLAYR